jgi:hypothetical protein
MGKKDITKQLTPVVLKDDENVRNVVIQINLKNGTTMVVSGFSAWDNLAYIMEALAVTAEQCVVEGMEKKDVYQEISDYLKDVLPSYEVRDRVVN